MEFAMHSKEAAARDAQFFETPQSRAPRGLSPRRRAEVWLASCLVCAAASGALAALVAASIVWR
jgi:hypothetical protein